jgi:hypothetical protein
MSEESEFEKYRRMLLEVKRDMDARQRWEMMRKLVGPSADDFPVRRSGPQHEPEVIAARNRADT